MKSDTAKSLSNKGSDSCLMTVTAGEKMNFQLFRLTIQRGFASAPLTSIHQICFELAIELVLFKFDES